MRYMRDVFCRAALLFATFGVLTGSLQAQGFASSVVVAGDEVLVAEPRAGGADGGIVYVYTRSADGWVEGTRLIHPEPSAENGFGMTLALSGDRLLVTAVNMGAPEAGGVYSYSRTAEGWSHDGRIVPDGLPEGMLFGMTMAIEGDVAAIAALSRSGSSAVLVFRNVDGNWIQDAMLEDPTGEERTGFGNSIAVSGGTLVVGAPLTGSQAGIAYLYAQGQDGWSASGELAVSDGEGAFFGTSAMFLGDRLLVGAGSPFGQPGSVVTFAQQDGEWTETGRLAAFDGGASDGFGSTMATDGQTLWVGAPGANGRRGGIYEFVMDDSGDWTSVNRITAPQPEAGDWMGTIVAQGGDVLVSGMPRDDYGLGTALIFDREGDGWTTGQSILMEVEGYDPVLGEQLDCAEGAAAVFGCSDVDLVSFVPVEDLGGARGVRVNDVWGWTDTETNRDYAIVGRMDGTSFVDVTDPVNPVVVGNLPKTESSPGSAWRDMKVYRDHVYIVADGAAAHGMQVFDLTRLRDFSGTMLDLDVDVHYDLLHSVHNIVINEETGFAYAVGSSGGGDTCGGGLHMIDIREPKNPTFAGCFAHPNTGRRGTGYSHDAQCVIYNGPDEEHAGREICFGSNETALSIADVTDKENPVVLGMARYPNVAYTHQGWLTEDQSHFYMNDELDEVQGLAQNTRTLIFDVADLDQPILLKEHFSENTSSDHNLYIRGNLMYQSNYNSGLRVFDITDVENPREVAFFDTVPGEDSPSMDGSWSNYPFFASGIVVVTSGRQGLFLVKKRDRTPVS